MASVIEAKSLSTLTSLASNPPEYPRNPNYVRHDPLVLYIARVPGSRDVFLTPIKPREKVVTAEDVQSSLYYLHFDQPEDVRYLSPQEPDYSQRYQEVDSTRLEALRIAERHTKQISTVTNSAIHAHQALTSPRKEIYPNRDTITEDVNFGTHEVQSQPLTRKPVSLNTLPRRNVLEPNQENGVPSRPPRKPLVEPMNYNTTRPGLTYPAGPAYENHAGEEYRDNIHTYPQPSRSLAQDGSPGISLTLIRRDPGSGAQWNVAKINDSTLVNFSSTGTNDTPKAHTFKTSGNPVLIQIINPGYFKFSNQNRRSKQFDPSQPEVFRQYNERQPNSDVQIASDNVNSSNQFFKRQLWMEGMSHGSSSVDPSENRSPMSHNSLHVTSGESKKSAFRGYVFHSPWGGRCEFYTGTSGGSLKCKHFVPAGNSMNLAYSPVTVSELRFNLPPSFRHTPTDSSSSHKRSSYFGKRAMRRSDSASLDIGDQSQSSHYDKLDLSLGQEMAGGGFGGKQAKLGKLILEDEGLRMMDLLVAANLALWWRAYER